MQSWSWPHRITQESMMTKIWFIITPSMLVTLWHYARKGCTAPLTFDLLNCFKETSRYVCILYRLSTLRRSDYFFRAVPILSSHENISQKSRLFGSGSVLSRAGRLVLATGLPSVKLNARFTPNSRGTWVLRPKKWPNSWLLGSWSARSYVPPMLLTRRS